MLDHRRVEGLLRLRVLAAASRLLWRMGKRSDVKRGKESAALNELWRLGASTDHLVAEMQKDGLGRPAHSSVEKARKILLKEDLLTDPDAMLELVSGEHQIHHTPAITPRGLAYLAFYSRFYKQDLKMSYTDVGERVALDVINGRQDRIEKEICDKTRREVAEFVMHLSQSEAWCNKCGAYTTMLDVHSEGDKRIIRLSCKHSLPQAGFPTFPSWI